VALFNRLYDMLAGVADGHSLETFDDESGDVFVMSSIGIEDLPGFLRCAKNYLEFTHTEDWPQSWTDEELKEKAFHFDNLRHFDTLNKAVEHLYSYGFRA
jgi:hypothetical protein